MTEKVSGAQMALEKPKVNIVESRDVFKRLEGMYDTIAKRADVWSAKQLRAGYEYLLRQA